MQSKPPLKPVGVKVSMELMDRLTRISAAKRRSKHWLMLEAIRQFVEREEVAEKFREETIEAWSDYERDPIKFTADEVFDFISGWERVHESERTKCHE